jgi:hypothetical protein
MPHVLILLLLLGGALTFGLGSPVTPAQVGPPMHWAAISLGRSDPVAPTE